ncbi:MAG TPA: MmgE/PrpD family protein, partial [Dehalococcoidia bacterium]|nr:MmgE/PrpD family protein [Dehalococcoidia bacterium]
TGGQQIDIEAAARGLGETWEIIDAGIGVKLYPCCYATHRAIDAALELRQRHGIEAARIERVEARLSRGTLVPLRREPPTSGLEGKFSLEYCLAAALLDGRVGLDTFGDEAVRRPEARALARRVAAAEGGPPMAFPIEGWADVRVVMSTGEAFEMRVDRPRGDPQRPLTWDELAAKFRDCAALALPPPAVDKAIAAIEGLEEAPDVRALVEVLTGGRVTI